MCLFSQALCSWLSSLVFSIHFPLPITWLLVPLPLVFIHYCFFPNCHYKVFFCFLNAWMILILFRVWEVYTFSPSEFFLKRVKAVKQLMCIKVSSLILWNGLVRIYYPVFIFFSIIPVYKTFSLMTTSPSNSTGSLLGGPLTPLFRWYEDGLIRAIFCSFPPSRSKVRGHFPSALSAT